MRTMWKAWGLAAILALGAVPAAFAEEGPSGIDIRRDTGTRSDSSGGTRPDRDPSRLDRDSFIVRDRDTRLRSDDPDRRGSRHDELELGGEGTRAQRYFDRDRDRDDDGARFDRSDRDWERRLRSDHRRGWVEHYEFYTRDYDRYDWYDNDDRWDRDSNWYWEYRTRDRVNVRENAFWNQAATSR
ncbi:MAG: hypothetical protein BWZ08_00472 [candidate division BRC1 bacterium ADurb.BinA292]|nr:MAG: hypothetical protein BWZ08_00472 [candidate division BRC1 bacterium ADurb.BinA292]